jgi:hypothetical protein
MVIAFATFHVQNAPKADPVAYTCLDDRSDDCE